MRRAGADRRGTETARRRSPSTPLGGSEGLRTEAVYAAPLGREFPQGGGGDQPVVVSCPRRGGCCRLAASRRKGTRRDTVAVPGVSPARCDSRRGRGGRA